MQKYFKLSNILPEAIALLIILTRIPTQELAIICLLLPICSLILRSIWQSAIIVHGLGHTIAIAFADRQLSFLNLNNILEHQSLATILKSLLPFTPIFIPIPQSPHVPCTSTFPYLSPGNSNRIRFKALGGIIFNLLGVIVVGFCPNTFVSQTLIVANLLIALTSLSDLNALITGTAEYLYCGNFGFIAQRQLDDGKRLLPARMRQIMQTMGQETEVRGEQAGGGLVMGRDRDRTVFVGKKIVNQKRANLTKSLESAFARTRKRAIASGIKPPESTMMGVWHYRYATSGTAPSELETHWHQWTDARKDTVWQFTGTKWLCSNQNVNHRITHNGDFNAWTLFGEAVDSATLGLWLERVLHTPNAAKGDSPKIAGMMDLLITQGMWYPSVRLAYQQAIATSIKAAFNGQEPAVDALNTAPSPEDLNNWTEIFNHVFTLEIFILEQSNSLESPRSLKSSTRLKQNLLQALRDCSSTTQWSEAQKIAFIEYALQAFFDNNLYRATQIFISQAQGTFGLVTASTLEATKLVLTAKEQPITIGVNREQGYTIYASQPTVVDRVLLGNSQSFRLDLKPQEGEIAQISARNITVYSLSQQHELMESELKDRWISMADHPYLSYIKLLQTGDRDLVASDISSIPKILHEIKLNWQNSRSLNLQSADYLVYLLTEKVQRFEKKQRIIFHSGLISQVRPMSSVDLLITGEENSLWLGEKFAQDLKTIFPLLNVVTVSANEVLQQLSQDFSQLCLSKDSLVLAITQSGQTFSTVEAIEAFDCLCSQGIIGEVFILTGELSSFINSTQGKGGLTAIYTASLDNNNQQRIFVNGSGHRTAEPSTVEVAATSQTLTELSLYLAKQMRKNFPCSHPFGMTLTPETLQVLAMMKEDFLNRNVIQIVGTDARGKSIKSAIRQRLIRGGRHWGNHIIETPLAWIFHALYILISVGWIIPFGHPLSLVKALSGPIINLAHLPQNLGELMTPIVTIADIAVYIFGAWLWTLLLRYFQGRQLLARMGKRTLVIGDVSWVNQLLQAYVSKLFSLSYGIATIEVHSANPQNHLLHAFAHRVVRGTLIWLGVPDGRRSRQQQAAENAVIMTGRQANGVRNLNVGAEIVAMGQNPTIARQGFSDAIVLGSNNDSLYFRNPTVAEQKEQIEELRESYFGAFERLLASYVFFWALAKKVASVPFLKYEYWKSQSRTKIMTTASPVAGLDWNRLTKRSRQHSAAQDYLHQN